MAKSVMRMVLGQTPSRFTSGGMSLEEAERQADEISGHTPVLPDPPPVEDERSPEELLKADQAEDAKFQVREIEQANLDDIPSANETLALNGAEQMQIKMDVSEQILGALPGKGMWDVENNRAVFFTEDGKKFDGLDVANSAGAIENFVEATMGEEFRSIYSRSVTAPLDPAFRLQENAKGTANPILAQMQKDGIISEEYTEDEVAVVEDTAVAGITSKLQEAAPTLLSKGAAPTDLMIQFGAKLADTKEFKELPDAAKVAIVRDLAERVDQADNAVVSKTLTAISERFNQVEQNAESEVAQTVQDLSLGDYLPVDSHERAGLLQQTAEDIEEIRVLSQTIHIPDTKKVLDTPWEIRQQEVAQATARLGGLKQKVSKNHRKALRDQPRAAIDQSTAALFDINRDLVAEGLTLDKMVSSLEANGIDLAKLPVEERRKVLLERAVDKWFVSKSKDPVQAPVFAALRQKMLNTIEKGGKLDPHIESSVSGLVSQISAVSQQASSKEVVEAREGKYDNYKKKFESSFYKRVIESDDPQALLEENKAFLNPEDYQAYEAHIKEPPQSASVILDDKKASKALKKAALHELEKESVDVANTVAESLKFIRRGERNTKSGLLESADKAMEAVVASGLKKEHKAALLNLLAKSNEISGITRGEFVDGYGYDKLYEFHTAATAATGSYGGWTEFMDMYAALDRKLGGEGKNLTKEAKKNMVDSFIKEASDPLMNSLRAAAVSRLTTGQ